MERTALQFAEHTLLALQKANSVSFASIPDPPAYARPALGDSTKDSTPATAPPPKQQRPLVRKPAARLSPVVARALIRASAQQQQVQQQQRAGEAAFASPRLTAGWTPKVLHFKSATWLSCMANACMPWRRLSSRVENQQKHACILIGVVMARMLPCMQVDAMETANHYQLEIALPGVRKGAHQGSPSCLAIETTNVECMCAAIRQPSAQCSPCHRGCTRMECRPGCIYRLLARGLKIQSPYRQPATLSLLQRTCAWSCGAPS